jgi:hypothetical protein
VERKGTRSVLAKTQKRERDGMRRAHRTDHRISKPQTASFRPGGRPASFLFGGSDVTNGLSCLYLEAWDGLRRTVDAIHQRPRSRERNERVHAEKEEEGVEANSC